VLDSVVGLSLSIRLCCQQRSVAPGTVVVAFEAKNIDNSRDTKSVAVPRHPNRPSQACHRVPYSSPVFPQRQQYERLLSYLPSAGYGLLQQRRGLPVQRM
jgi:hypothetical protein